MPDRTRVDAYIAGAAPFARPILTKIREAFHRGCPGIEERIKWGVPSFEKRGLVGGMAAFKAHATFGFWRGGELEDPAGILKGRDRASFMAVRVEDIAQLPPVRVLAEYVRRAAALNDLPKPPAPPKKKKPELRVPPDLAKALKGNARARAAFEGFPPSHRREYIEWITEAKRPETRSRRLATTLEWLAQGKSRNWKYENC
ncbi:MAG: YdeI/OmpD-associated family protein [Candidatus Brocadiae bacterium]|nr:YdeI/OmpD-associated family protein [Candidatus Brocadiia bacterium]